MCAGIIEGLRGPHAHFLFPRGPASAATGVEELLPVPMRAVRAGSKSSALHSSAPLSLPRGLGSQSLQSPLGKALLCSVLEAGPADVLSAPGGRGAC
jgi:hypothetical protein